jgi:hypothetical protein
MKSIMNHLHKRARGINLLLALLVSLAISGMVPTTVQAQEITGAITGTVIDPSGAAVPGAQVTATNVLQGTTWPTQTNPAGVYNFPRLPVGQYTVKVEAKGFATSVRGSFELAMNQSPVSMFSRLQRVTRRFCV